MAKGLNIKKLQEAIKRDVVNEDVEMGVGNSNGTSLQGYFPDGTTYADLVKVFGEPTKNVSGHDKIDAEWVGLIDSETFTIYNYKTGKNYLGDEGQAVEDITDWHIGGRNKRVVDAVLDYFNSKKLGESIKSEVIMNEQKKEEEDPNKPATSLLKKIHKASDNETLEKILNQLEKDTVSGKINAEQDTRLKAAWDRRKKALEANPTAPETEVTPEEEKSIEESK